MVANWDMQKSEGEKKTTSRGNGSRRELFWGCWFFVFFLVFRDCLARWERGKGLNYLFSLKRKKS